MYVILPGEIKIKIYLDKNAVAQCQTTEKDFPQQTIKCTN